MACLARLTNWEKTNSPIGTSNKRASIVRLCKNIPQKGNLCEECLKRPTDGKYQSRMMHGLLTERIPDHSHIYGSMWYWERVFKHGDPSSEWLIKAEKAQKEGENVKGGFVVQRPSVKEMEMRKTKKASVVPAATATATTATATTATATATKGTLFEKFAPIKVLYQESDKDPEMMSTDTCTIKKVVVRGVECWVADMLVFDCDTTGEPGEYIGMMIDGEFREK